MHGIDSPATWNQPKPTLVIKHTDGTLPPIPAPAAQSARAAALARTSKYAAGPVDPGDDRETRPSAEGISDEEIEEVGFGLIDLSMLFVGWPGRWIDRRVGV